MTALVATRLAEDGAIDRILSAQQQELEHRQAVLSEILGRFGVHGHPTSTHAWLPLSEPWRGADFASACLRKGVVVLPGNAFAVGREPTQHGVRINVGAARSRDDLQKALSIMADLLNTGSLQVGSFI
jgi:DNA-binding transcriptional MocR family regulator